jgi:hypothetical protein
VSSNRLVGTTTPGPLESGVWSDISASMAVEENNSTLTVGCAEVTSSEAIVVAADGSFNIGGDYVVSAGPVINPDNSTEFAAQPVHIFGRIVDQQMEVRILFDIINDGESARWIPALDQPPLLLEKNAKTKTASCR